MYLYLINVSHQTKLELVLLAMLAILFPMEFVNNLHLKELVMLDALCGTGIAKFVLPVLEIGLKIIKEFVFQFLINANSLIRLEHAQVVMLDIKLNQENVS